MSFGGPIAHLGYFHNECVRRRGWLDEAAYADLVALCQFLPGPASSQVAFALGLRRAGPAGAIAAAACFTLPSAALMIGAAYGISALSGPAAAGWVHGLKLAAVAVVAQAVWTMGRRLCPDWPRRMLALGAAAAAVALPFAWAQVAIIAAGAMAGWVLTRGRPAVPAGHDGPAIRGHHGAIAALALFALLLFGSWAVAEATGSKHLAVFDGFYRSGAMVFGGGHVVLPLLRAEVVGPPHEWMSDEAFLAGYGAAQAVPGPLFTFAAYLGAVIYRGEHAWLGGLWCLLAIFLPGWLLIAGAMPFWERLRGRAWAQACLRGANAAVVGLLLAALYSPVCTQSIRSVADGAAALAGVMLLQWAKAPPIVVVGVMAIAGWALSHRMPPA